MSPPLEDACGPSEPDAAECRAIVTCVDVADASRAHDVRRGYYEIARADATKKFGDFDPDCECHASIIANSDRFPGE
jgi:hypothetical protein